VTKSLCFTENDIGFLYEMGLSVAHDYSQAAMWYQKAAATGYPRAQFHLGSLYFEGRGVAADPQKAHDLVKQAADNGDEKASRWLSAH
jgi:uncharacterized protein